MPYRKFLQRYRMQRICPFASENYNLAGILPIFNDQQKIKK